MEWAAGLPSTADKGVPCLDMFWWCWLFTDTAEVLYDKPGGELSADSSPSATGPTEAETDRRKSEGRRTCECAGCEGAAGAAIADIDGGMDERRLLCLYV